MCLLSGLSTHAEINEHKIGIGIYASKEQQAGNFQGLFNKLSETSYADTNLFTNCGEFTVEEWLPQTRTNKDGYYQLVAEKHILTLAWNTIDHQIIYYFYEPNIGELVFSGNNPNDIISRLKSTLDDYLSGKSSA